VTQQHNRSNNQLAATTKSSNNQPIALTKTATATCSDDSANSTGGDKNSKSNQSAVTLTIYFLF